jgi:DNA-binding transcriptional regulator YdaS (Cro superfamily)
MVTSAIERAKGERTQAEFADLIGVTQPLVSYWLKRQQVGAQYVLAVEAKTGVSRHELRPDIFGPPQDVAA